jgi:endonuclease/exonuclease/phosphatase (EEP) superfamily protein YafD
VKPILAAVSALARLVALLLALAAAAGAAGGLGGVFDDRLDILTHAAPIYLVAGVLAVTLYLLTGDARRGLILTLGAVAVLAAGWLMAPDVIAAVRDQKATPGGQTLKLVQFNVWGRNADPEGTARWILSEDPDIVVLEEAFDASMLVPKALAKRYPHRTTCAEPQLCSTMILAKDRPSAEGGFGSSSSPTHLSAAWSRFGSGRTGFTVVGVHYTWPIPAGPQQAQSERLAKAIEGFDRRSLIIAGDFNSTPWSYALRRQDARFGLIRRTHALFSWPAAPFSRRRINSPLPFLPIDHVYAGADWRTAEVRRGPRLGSDHYPVVVSLTRDASP